ncbi:MAG TPA: DNA-processing protein DprA [Rhodothermales bacterium]|nr:DNA-processing protein DprA [Rhodothermales bacterium]
MFPFNDIEPTQVHLFDQPADEATERRAVMALALVPGIGPGRLRALIAHFGSASQTLRAPIPVLMRVSGIGQQTAEAITRCDVEALLAEQEKRASICKAIPLLSWESTFPALLRELYDPPVLLWHRGVHLPSDEKALAIVGTRKASDYGKRVAYTFAQELARNGWTIVSGLAYGIDTAAHQGAVDVGGRTVAVLGSGVDVIYPAANTRLVAQILENGAIFSELPMGTKPDAINFPRRNRIISGLSRGVLVAEAAAKGGALITAHMAMEQNREVFTVPCSIFSTHGKGNHELVRKNIARLVTTVDELLEELEGFGTTMVSAVNSEETWAELNALERILLENLSAEPTHIDKLCVQAHVDASAALVYLLNLEFKGLVRQMAGKMFYRT